MKWGEKRKEPSDALLFLLPLYHPELPPEEESRFRLRYYCLHPRGYETFLSSARVFVITWPAVRKKESPLRTYIPFPSFFLPWFVPLGFCRLVAHFPSTVARIAIIGVAPFLLPCTIDRAKKTTEPYGRVSGLKGVNGRRWKKEKAFRAVSLPSAVTSTPIHAVGK